MNLAIPPRVLAEVARIGRAATVGIIVATCGLGVLGCLTAALWIAALPYVGPAGAPVVAAVALALVAVAAIAVLQRNAPPTAPQPIPAPAVNDVAQLLDLATLMTRTDKVPMLLAALLAGAVAGARPK